MNQVSQQKGGWNGKSTWNNDGSNSNFQANQWSAGKGQNSGKGGGPQNGKGKGRGKGKGSWGGRGKGNFQNDNRGNFDNWRGGETQNNSNQGKGPKTAPPTTV